MRSNRSIGLSFILMAGALTGCSVAPRDTRAVYEPVTDITATSTPMAQLSPSAGEVVAVLESRSGGVLTQRIVLKGDPQTPGENAVTIKVDQGARGLADLKGAVPKPTETLIESELNEGFGDIDMRMSLTWNRNSFGPFGYAIGHAAQSVTCIYAWQYSAGRAPRIVDTPGAYTSGGSMPSAPTSVRARLCKTGLGEAEIVAILREMTISAPGSNAPYVDPAFEGSTPSGGRDALAASGVPGGYFLAPKSPVARNVAVTAPSRIHPGRTRRRVVTRDRPRKVRVIRYEPVPIQADPQPTTRVVNVPLPGGPAPSSAPVSVSAPAQNPLLAPLQGMGGARSASADDMPLPPRAAPAPARAPVAAASAEARPIAAPVPLPN